jgi:4-hydroxy-tetrahydrodipicolinate reductase
MISVGVIGHGGRMGSEVCAAVHRDDELQLVARVGRGDDLQALVDAGADVAVEFSTPQSVRDNVFFCVDHGIHTVVGATGLTPSDLDEISRRIKESRARVVVAPNFSTGAVLMMALAATAASYFDSVEVIERHHEKKVDAPSGTAVRTVEVMNDSRARPWREPAGGAADSRGLVCDGVRIHSVRLPGSVAHQEVIFGGIGETLTIRHDSLDRSSFMPGVVLAIKRVATLDGLTVGLENLLGL